jgi:hypothetical protein
MNVNPVGRQRAGTYEAEGVMRWSEPTEESGGLAESYFALNWAIRSNQCLKLG